MGTRPEGTNDANVSDTDGRSPPSGRPVLVGELLFDVFPDGSRILGGAPFNVAWHLQAFGLRPLVVSRIGDDDLGHEVLEAMADWGMDCTGVQIDDEAATGRVTVELDNGVPTFDIAAGQAWDRLDGARAVAAVRAVDTALLYHGTLAARSDSGREALETVRSRGRTPVFMDVNLRDPWWRADVVAELLAAAGWAKLNSDELGRLAPADSTGPPDDLEAAAADLAARHDLDQVVVTCGEDGAFVWSDRRWLAGRPPLQAEVVDTVGAGDAFSAVWLAGLLRGWPPELTLMRALEFAAAVCSVRGATTPNRRIYDTHLEAWERA